MGSLEGRAHSKWFLILGSGLPLDDGDDNDEEDDDQEEDDKRDENPP